jgi:hypothetical protein
MHKKDNLRKLFYRKLAVTTARNIRILRSPFYLMSVVIPHKCYLSWEKLSVKMNDTNSVDFP